MKSSLPKPTAAQSRRMQIIKCEVGCVVCMHPSIDRDPVPCEAHHVLSGGKRISHDHTYGLCHEHHQGNHLSIHRTKRKVLELIGSEQDAIDLTDELVADFEARIVK